MLEKITITWVRKFIPMLLSNWSCALFCWHWETIYIEFTNDNDLDYMWTSPWDFPVLHSTKTSLKVMYRYRELGGYRDPLDTRLIINSGRAFDNKKRSVLSFYNCFHSDTSVTLLSMLGYDTPKALHNTPYGHSWSFLFVWLVMMTDLDTRVNDKAFFPPEILQASVNYTVINGKNRIFASVSWTSLCPPPSFGDLLVEVSVSYRMSVFVSVYIGQCYFFWCWKCNNLQECDDAASS